MGCWSYEDIEHYVECIKSKSWKEVKAMEECTAGDLYWEHLISISLAKGVTSVVYDSLDILHANMLASKGVKAELYGSALNYYAPFSAKCAAWYGNLEIITFIMEAIEADPQFLRDCGGGYSYSDEYYNANITKLKEEVARATLDDCTC